MNLLNLVPKTSLAWLVAAAAGIVLLAGCGTMSTQQNQATAPTPDKDSDDGPWGGKDYPEHQYWGKIDNQVTIRLPNPNIGPTANWLTGTSGTLSIPPGVFGNGNNGSICFPTANGWDRYYTTFYFLGPNTVPPNPNNYPNPDNLPVLTLAMDPTNGTSLMAGIVIVENLKPTNYVCSLNANGIPNLGTVSMNMGNNTKYRATVFYRSGTLNGRTNIVMDWSYHMPLPASRP